jgi:hypothetical protein
MWKTAWDITSANSGAKRLKNIPAAICGSVGAHEMAEVIGRELHLPPSAARCSDGAMIPALQTRMCKGRIQGR